MRRLEFTGNTFTRDRVLRREVLINEGDIYNQIRLEQSVLRLNQTSYFDPIDKDKDVEIRTDEESGDVDLILKVKEKGRQQIQFNGGVSGIGGSFFGLEYSTNNLLGRGETVALNFGFGNRQRNFQFSFQEPYFRDRPITVGFSLFGSSYKFFGEGTSFVQDPNTINNLINSNFGNTKADSNNLFTQSTYGASVFATTQLSELFFKKRRWSNFSRIGLTYQYSATTIKDPPVNSSGDPTKVIPIVFAQPNIITSRVTGSFVYDTREPSANGIDTLRGSSLSATFALSGLGGDVRTYQPTISYSNFIPVRRKKSPNAEVFAFRILAGTIGTLGITDKIKNANSLSFIDGIPYYERYFLGSENDIRGYDSRSIAPVARIDGFVTTQDVVVATNATGAPIEVTGLTAAQKLAITSLGTFTGSSGANPLQTTANYQYIGGDTQLLGNFEYRVPIFGPLTVAGFADVGTAFNLKKGGTQAINSSFLRDDLFLGSSNINTLIFLYRNDSFLTAAGSYFLRSGSLLSTTQYITDYCTLDTNGDGVFNECPTALPAAVSEVFLRGNAQTNTRVNVGSSAFSKIGNFRASVGIEMRVQVPIVNVPFRLIYFYNPNIKIGFGNEAPGLFLPGKRSGIRFTVGRTF